MLYNSINHLKCVLVTIGLSQMAPHKSQSFEYLAPLMELFGKDWKALSCGRSCVSVGGALTLVRLGTLLMHPDKNSWPSCHPAFTSTIMDSTSLKS